MERPNVHKENQNLVKPPRKRNQTEEPANRANRRNMANQQASVSADRRNLIKENIDKVVYDN